MGRNVDDIPFPERPKKQKKQKQKGEKSGGGTGTQVGIAWVLLAVPAGTMLVCLLFILRGHGII